MQLLEKDENLLAAKIVAVVVAAAAGLGTGAAVVETEFEVGYCCLEQRPRVVRVGESEAERACAGTGPDEASNECVQKVRICCITNEKKNRLGQWSGL